MLVDVIIGVLLLLMLIDIGQIRRKVNKIRNMTKTQAELNDKMEKFTRDTSKAIKDLEKQIQNRE